LPATLNNVKRN